MKTLLIILLFFLTFQTTGQSIEKVTALLKERGFVPFKQFVDAPPKTNVDIHTEILREIIPGYQEGVVKIEEYPLAGRDTDNTIHNYQIKFLTTEKSIFYYVFDKAYGKEIENNVWESYYQLIDSFVNTAEHAKFLRAFFTAYNVELNEKELFQTSIVYGNSCGIGGVPTEFQLKLDSLLEKKDFITIHSWLKSPNTEKQLYAIQGLKKLENSGYRLTSDDIRIIDIISQKTGMVNTCSGCTYSANTIKSIIAQIPSNNGNKGTRVIFYYSLAAILFTVILFLFYKRHKPGKGGVQQ